MNYKSIDAPPVDVDFAGRTVIVYGSKFGNIDLDEDMILPGSYTKAIRERGKSGANLIYKLTDHKASMASMLGKPDLEEDAFGLKSATKIVDTNWGNDVLKMYEAGLINQHSVGFGKATSTRKQTSGGKYYSEITEVPLYEVSAVLWGANPDTPTVGIKSGKDLLHYFYLIEKQLQEGTLTDETFAILQKHHDAIGIALKGHRLPVIPDFTTLSADEACAAFRKGLTLV